MHDGQGVNPFAEILGSLCMVLMLKITYWKVTKRLLFTIIWSFSTSLKSMFLFNISFPTLFILLESRCRWYSGECVLLFVSFNFFFLDCCSVDYMSLILVVLLYMRLTL